MLNRLLRKIILILCNKLKFVKLLNAHYMKKRKCKHDIKLKTSLNKSRQI